MGEHLIPNKTKKHHAEIILEEQRKGYFVFKKARANKLNVKVGSAINHPETYLKSTYRCVVQYKDGKWEANF